MELGDFSCPGSSNWPVQVVVFVFFLNIYLFGSSGSSFRHAGSSFAACELLAAVCGILFPEQGLN